MLALALCGLIALLVALLAVQERVHRSERSQWVARYDGLNDRLYAAFKEGYTIPEAASERVPPPPELSEPLRNFLLDFDEAGRLHYQARIESLQRDGLADGSIMRRLMRERGED